MKDYVSPVHVDVGMLEIEPRKKDILDVRDDFITISPKDFKDTVQSSFAERRERKFLKHFRPVDPVVRPLYVEIIHQFVDNKSFSRLLISIPLVLCFSKISYKLRTSYNLSTKRILPIG